MCMISTIREQRYVLPVRKAKPTENDRQARIRKVTQGEIFGLILYGKLLDNKRKQGMNTTGGTI